jgi:hypothetical protein
MQQRDRLPMWSAVLALAATVGAAAFYQQAAAQPQGRPMDRQRMQAMMPLMMQMHQQQAMMANPWLATEKAVFVLRDGKLTKYDKDFNVLKTVDLPKMSMPMLAQDADDAPSDAQGATQASQSQQQQPSRPMMQKRMQQMMARMHGMLPTKLEETSDALYVSWGAALLKYDHDLNLEKKLDMPAAKQTDCPMCARMMRMMQRMRGGHSG